MRARGVLSKLFVATLIAGCAAPNAAPFPGSVAREQRAAGPPSGRAMVSIRIPRRTTKTHYVSPATKSMTIAANGRLVGTFNVTPASAGCTRATGSTECTFHLGIPTGRVVFAVKTFDAVSGKGKLLGSGSVVQTVEAGKVAIIALTLSGVVASVKVALQLPNPPAGIATTTSAIVTAFDASGAAIVGPGNYNVPVKLSDGDGSGATTLSGATIAGPGASAVLTYDGGPLVSASVGASVAGVAPAKISPAIFSPVPGVVASFAMPASIAADEPYAIAAGPDGNLWFTTDAGTPEAIVKTTTAGAMTVYEGGVNIPTSDRYLGIASGPDGALWFTERNAKQIGRIDTSGNVTEYAATGSAGTACPNRIAAGPAADGAMWFTSECGGLIGRITTAGIVQTFAPGAGTNLQDILLGKDNNLYAIDRTKHAIAQIVVSGGAVGAFSEVVVGASPSDFAANTAMLGLSQTGDGTLWWTNVACTPSTIGSLPIASPFSASSVFQNITLQGCGEPAFMAVAPAGGQSLWTAEYNMPTLEEVSAPVGGGAPALTDISVPTPPGTASQLWDVVRGPDGNLWATNRNAGGTILKLAY